MGVDNATTGNVSSEIGEMVDNSSDLILRNFRPIQELGNRTVVLYTAGNSGGGAKGATRADLLSISAAAPAGPSDKRPPVSAASSATGSRFFLVTITVSLVSQYILG